MSDKLGGRKRSAAELDEHDEEDVSGLREQLAASNREREKQAAIIQQREQQLAASVQERERLVASNQEKEQQLVASNQEKEQQLVASNQERERLVASNQKLEDNSIFALLSKESQSEGLFTFQCRGNDSSHTTSNSHLPATTKRTDFVLESVTLDEDLKGHISMLMVQRDGCKTALQYQSEADISMYTSLALNDAIKMVSLIKGIHLACRHERSIFSQRPDHMVVYDVESNLPIIAVEDKKPAPGGILTPKTAGQVFDYAVSMQAFGHRAPFVVLSSVEETYVTWLDEALPQALATRQGRVEAVSTNGSSPSVDRSAQAVNQVDETPSPPNLIDGGTSPQAQILLKSQAPVGNQKVMFNAQVERKFCLSSCTYNSSQLAPVLYSAILCGLQGLDKSSAKSITRFTPPCTKTAKCCLELSKDSYCWGTLSSSQARGTRLKKSSTKRYYVVGILGSGNTSKVFHAVDLDCTEYAIKMYLHRLDGNTYLKKNAFEKKALHSATNEVKNFKLIYPKLTVVHEKLNKHHCVVMPFFDPVPKDQRASCIDGIRNVLKMFARKQLKYKDQDVRWRHVGMYEGKCILYDLAELEESTSNRFVSQHVKEFKTRAMIASHSTGQTFSSIEKHNHAI